MDLLIHESNQRYKPGENLVLPENPGCIRIQEADLKHFRQSLIRKSVKKHNVTAPTDTDLRFLADETKTDIVFVKETLGL